MSQGGASIMLELRREARFAVLGFCVAFATLVPGVVFYKSMINKASESAAASVDLSVRSKHQEILNQLQREIEFVTNGNWFEVGRNGLPKIKADLSKARPFDLVIFFDSQRKVLDALKRSSGMNGYELVSPQVSADLIPVDTGFFDSVRDGEIISGLMEVERQPLIVAIREVRPLGLPGYLLLGRAFDRLQLSVQGSYNSEKSDSHVLFPSKFDVFNLSDEAALPSNVRKALEVALQNNGWTYSMMGKGGELYTVIDDLLRRPAILVKSPWSLPSYLVGARSYQLFFLVSMAVGVLTWWLLRRSDVKNRSKTRRFEGLASLTTDNVRIFVEAFPGFAFAVTSDMKYLAVSRILAGVTGHESSEFVNIPYGTICSESDEGDLTKAFADLRDHHYWPPIRNFEHSVAGLGEMHDFFAAAHYLTKHDILLVILTKKESAQFVRLPESIKRNSKSDSAVA